MGTEKNGGRVAGKVALVTGGGTGIGAAVAARLAAEGATVVVCGRRPEPPQQVAERIVAAGGSARAVSADVSDEARFAAVLGEVEEREGRLDILINNAFSYAGGMIADTSTAEWRAAFATSLDAAFFGLRAALPGMVARGGGSVVNVSSVMALLTIPGASAYSAAKSALISLTRSAALEGARAGVRVNVVIPGVIMTPSTKATLPDEAAERGHRRFGAQRPHRRSD